MQNNLILVIFQSSWNLLGRFSKNS